MTFSLSIKKLPGALDEKLSPSIACESLGATRQEQFFEPSRGMIFGSDEWPETLPILKQRKPLAG